MAKHKKDIYNKKFRGKDLDNIDNLRKRAELLHQLTSDIPLDELYSEEMPKLIHDLQVHQIELEMQNEELRRIQSELENSRTKYVDLYDFAPVGYFTFNDNGLILNVNLTGAKQLAAERVRIIDTPFIHYVEREDRDAFYLHLRTTLNTGYRQNCELKLNNKKDSQFSARLESIRVRNPEGDDVIRTSLTDITETKNLEYQLRHAQNMESIGTLAGGIAHDFNNLFTAALNYIFLSMGHLTQDHKAYGPLKDAESILMKATGLSQQLLTFSKGGSPVRKTISLIKLIRKSATFAVSGSNVMCDLIISEDLWPVEADFLQMYQVIHNIVLNASQSMPDGGTLSVNADNFFLEAGADVPLPEGRYVTIQITDHGIGISHDQLQRIFEPYFTTKQDGSGLGLAISYSIIKNHGGHISVTSSPGKGSAFTVYLPVSHHTITTEAIAAMTLVPGTGRILIMDDDEAVRSSLGLILKECGYEVAYSTNGRETVEKYEKAMEQSSPYDAVLMDLTIPGGMGGTEAVRILRTIDPDVKAVVLSGYSNDSVLSNFSDYGFSEALQKPCSPEKLSATLSSLLMDTSE